MKTYSRKTVKILSIVLILTMLFSTATTFAAGYKVSANPSSTGGKSPGGGNNSYKWHGNGQFLRISLYWAPGGAASDGSENANWDDWSKIKRMGKSFDLVLDNGDNPRYDVEAHSNYATALDYAENGNQTLMELRGGYSDGSNNRGAWVNEYQFEPGDTEEEVNANIGVYMEHPTPMNASDSGNLGTPVRDFFDTFKLRNFVLWYAGTQAAGQSLMMGEESLKNGVYTNEYGKKMQGTYMLVIEPGGYATANNKYRAFTGRDAINEQTNGGTRYSGQLHLVLARIAAAVSLENNMDYDNLQLVYRPLKGEPTLDSSAIENYFDDFRHSWGIGVFQFWSTEASLPVIKYYYNLTQSDLDRAARAGTSSGTSGQIAGTVPQFSYTEENGVPMLVESEYGYDENHRYGLRPKQGGAKYTLAEAIKKYPQLVNDKADNAEAIPNTAENYTAEAKETFKEQDYFLAGHYFNQRFPLVSNYGSGLTSVALRIFKVCPCKYQGQAYGAKAPLIFT